MLDAAERFGLSKFQLTCIEPEPLRLNTLMRTEDRERVQLLPVKVQDLPLGLFDELHENDILFIDSTHVLKTGSDVHYVLFSILPRLRPSVIVHFHDIQYPFEYPRQWILERNRSWNEIYARRAFMMYNEKFVIEFWCSMLANLRPDLINETVPLVMKNSGGSIWIRKRW
jgi:hypothetical protein